MEHVQLGHTYVTQTGKVRRVDTVEGPPGRQTIGWRDPSGSTGGRCDVTLFESRMVREATPDEIARLEGQRR